MRVIFCLIFCLFLISCGGDGIKDRDPKERMLREAMCVVSSEILQLYDHADKHRKHGLEAGRERFIREKTPNDFDNQVIMARNVMSQYSLSYHTQYLKNRCGFEG